MRKVWRVRRFVEHIQNGVNEELPPHQGCESLHADYNTAILSYPLVLDERYSRGHFIRGFLKKTINIQTFSPKTKNDYVKETGQVSRMAREIGYINTHTDSDGRKIACVSIEGEKMLTPLIGFPDAFLGFYANFSKLVYAVAGVIIGSIVTAIVSVVKF